MIRKRLPLPEAVAAPHWTAELLGELEEVADLSTDCFRCWVLLLVLDLQPVQQGMALQVAVSLTCLGPQREIAAIVQQPCLQHQQAHSFAHHDSTAENPHTTQHNQARLVEQHCAVNTVMLAHQK